MPSIEERIPERVAAEAEAARAWFANERGSEFKLTGIVDPEESQREGSPNGERSLQLILCGRQEGQDVCLRERFVVRPAESGPGFDVSHVADTTPDIGSPAPLLDPPAGDRRGWVDEVMKKHAFVVLLFYRGFW